MAIKIFFQKAWVSISPGNLFSALVWWDVRGVAWTKGFCGQSI